VAIDGPSGAGKTFTALIAAGVLAQGGRVAVIDTERGSASLYSDRFDFDVLELTNFNPQNYIDAIEAAEQAGYGVVVIDSLSHAWEGEGGALDMVDQASKRSQSGNSYTAWKNVTPLQRKLVDAMLQSPCHIVATMRSKTEYVLETNERGKQVPKKIGMAPVQRQGMEYEFTIVADMDIDHNLAVSKSRCEALADKVVLKPDARFWQIFVDWLNSGADVPPPPARESEPPPSQTAPAGNGQAGPAKPNAKMMATWLELVEEAKRLNVPVPVLTADVTAPQLAEVGRQLRDAVTAAKAKAQAAPPPPNGEKKKFTREELVDYVKQLGEQAKKLGLVGLAWQFNPRWSDEEVIKVGKDLKARIAAAKQKEPAHA
jgi:hypothetical protein